MPSLWLFAILLLLVCGCDSYDITRCAKYTDLNCNNPQFPQSTGDDGSAPDSGAAGGTSEGSQ
jgi:hypothetical protein